MQCEKFLISILGSKLSSSPPKYQIIKWLQCCAQSASNLKLHNVFNRLCFLLEYRINTSIKQKKILFWMSFLAWQFWKANLRSSHFDRVFLPVRHPVQCLILLLLTRESSKNDPVWFIEIYETSFVSVWNSLFMRKTSQHRLATSFSSSQYLTW